MGAFDNLKQDKLKINWAQKGIMIIALHSTLVYGAVQLIILFSIEIWMGLW